jgi:hypothetical protein
MALVERWLSWKEATVLSMTGGQTLAVHNHDAG